jgi:hypothetical protein
VSRRRVTLLALCLLVSAPRHAAAEAAEWRARLFRSDPLEVLRAVEEVAARPDASASLALLECALATTEPSVAVACGDALRALGTSAWADAGTVAAIAQARRSREPARLRNLARALGGLAHPNNDEAMADLAGPRRPVDVQQEALHMAASMGAIDATQFPLTAAAIAKALDSPTEEVRIAACDAAGEWKLRGLASRLVEIGTQAKGDLDGMFAVLALERMGWRGGVKPFAAAATRGSGGPARRSGVKAIARLAGAVDVAELRPLLFGRVPETAVAACHAVVRMGEELASAAAANPGAPQALDGAADLAKDLVALVASGSTEPERTAARNALTALGPASRGRVLAALPSWLDSSLEDVVLGGIEAAGVLGAVSLQDRLAGVVLDERAADSRRIAAARALGTMGAEAATERWGSLASSAAPGVRRRRAVWALGYVRDRRALDRLAELLEVFERDRDAVAEAERSLERLTGRRLGRSRGPWQAWAARTPNPFPVAVAAHDRAALRRDAAAGRLHGVTESTERAVERGLLYLARSQEVTGDFPGGPFAVTACETSYTSLAVLAFLGAGYAPGGGRHREAIRRAVRRIEGRQTADGAAAPALGGPPSYSASALNMVVSLRTPLAACALNEVVAYGRDSTARHSARMAIDRLGAEQAPGSGWRLQGYNEWTPQTAATAWALWACAAASVAAVPLPARFHDGAQAWLDGASTDVAGLQEDPADEGRPHAEPVGARARHRTHTSNRTMSVAQRLDASKFREISLADMGVVCRHLLGWPRTHPAMVGGGNVLIDHLPVWMDWEGEGPPVAWFYSYWMWGSLAAHVMGGRVERAWFDRMGPVLTDHQRNFPADVDGSWDFDDRRWSDRSVTYATACAVLALESGYRLGVR